MPNTAIKSIFSRFEPDQIFLLADSMVSFSSLPALDVIPVQHRMMVHFTEQEKSIRSVEKIWTFLLENHATRHSLLVCLGGGVITDLGGFAASTFKRGMAYLNIPSTLLAMVDASTGGKTGFNFHDFKNVIGTFSQPVDTLIVPSLLSSLPARELLSGYAELIKTSLLDSREFFRDAVGGLECLEDMDRMSSLIHRSLEVKQRIVAQDPHEKSLRKALNLGHTVGHALEELSLRHSPSAPLPHGFAVMQGLVAELYLSVSLLGMDKEVLRQLSHALVAYYGRPVCSCKDYDLLLQLMRDDKKNVSSSSLNFTLLHGIGSPQTDYLLPLSSMQVLTDALDYLFSL